MIRLLTLLFFLTACASHLQEKITQDYALAQFERAEKQLTDEIINKNADKDYSRCKDAVLLYLNRGMVRFANGDTKAATQDFKTAIEAIDYYNQELFVDVAKQILLEDSQSPYKGEDFEQTLARLYFALCLIHENDENNACAILRQAEEVDQQKRNAYCNHALSRDLAIEDNQILKILFSYYLSKKGDVTNAEVLKRQVEKELGVCLPSYQKNKGLLIVLCHNGIAPFKISSFNPCSTFSGIALEMLMEAHGFENAASSFVGIPLPELCSPLAHHPIPVSVNLKNIAYSLQTFCDVGHLADNALCKKMPLIAAKGAARLLMRRAIISCAQKQDPTLGALADLGMIILNANTHADTRCWNTLPMTIDAIFLPLEEGPHNLEINSSLYNYCYSTSNLSLFLKQGDICVINVFNLHPGITRVITPKKFITKENL